MSVSFDPRAVVARKPHECFACTAKIPKGQHYVACPSKDDADKFQTIHLCIECAYLLRHKTGEKPNSLSQGCFTERKIPNCLRKLRTEFRKGPAKAIQAMLQASCFEPIPPKPCNQIVVKTSEFDRRIFHLPESRYKVEQFAKGASLTIKAGVNGKSRTAQILMARSTTGEAFGCTKRQIAVLVA
jgi:hypothetical protein